MRSRQPRLSGLILLICLTLLPFGSLSASEKKAFLIIQGPGDPIYTYWGHIGIAIEDPESGVSSFYDFGNFSFHSENFYLDFAMGRMLYLGMETPTGFFINYSLTEDRDLAAYPLNFGEEEIEILHARLEWWMLPENREYLYDYFLDNCSTIIRDVLDEAVGGSLKEAAAEDIGVSFRHLARTGAHPSVAAELLIHFLLGPAQDHVIDEWEWMFLPEAVALAAADFDYTGRDGVRRRLIGDPVVYRESTRDPVPSDHRTLWPLLLMIGLLFGAVWTAGTLTEGRARSLRIAAVISGIMIILVVGLPGLVLGFMMLFTDHAAAYSNLNVGPALPTVLAGIVTLIRMQGRTGSERRKLENRLSILWSVNLAGLLAVMIIRAAGASRQDAFAFWAFYLPVLTAASWPGLMLRRRLFTKEG